MAPTLARTAQPPRPLPDEELTKLNALIAAYASPEVIEIADAVKKAAFAFDVAARTLEQDRLTDGVAKAREDVGITREGSEMQTRD